MDLFTYTISNMGAAPFGAISVLYKLGDKWVQGQANCMGRSNLKVVLLMDCKLCSFPHATLGLTQLTALFTCVPLHMETVPI